MRRGCRDQCDGRAPSMARPLLRSEDCDVSHRDWNGNSGRPDAARPPWSFVRSRLRRLCPRRQRRDRRSSRNRAYTRCMARTRNKPVDLQPVRATGLTLTGPSFRGPMAIGALSIGAVAIGAFAIGRLAIGRATIKRLTIDELEVRRLRVEDLEVVSENRGA